MEVLEREILRDELPSASVQTSTMTTQPSDGETSIKVQASTPQITIKSSDGQTSKSPESRSAGRKEARARTTIGFKSMSRAFTRRASTGIPINSRFVSLWRPNSDFRALLLRVGTCQGLQSASSRSASGPAVDGLLVVASLGFGGKEHLVTVEYEDALAVSPGRQCGPAVKLPYKQEDTLLLRIFRDAGGVRERETPLGEALLRLKAVGGGNEKPFPLSFRADVRLLDEGMDLAGVLPVEVAWQGLESREAADGWAAQLAPARVTRNLLAGVLADVLDGEVAAFKTYRVALQGVAAVFGAVWSANHDEKHAKIFAEGAQGEVIRAAIHSEHNALYGSTSLGGSVSRALGRKGRRKIEYLSTSQDLLRMIKCGVHRGMMRVYTFVILDSGLFFSETGARMARDVLSKHAVHANAEARVRYAGTFRCVFTRSHDMIIVVDNDSGTYRPAGEHLELVRRVFQINFPGLQVVALDVLQPQPDDTTQWVGPAEVPGNGSRPNPVYNGKWLWQPLMASTRVLLARSRLWWCLRSKRARRVAVPWVPEKPPPPCRELPAAGASDREEQRLQPVAAEAPPAHGVLEHSSRGADPGLVQPTASSPRRGGPLEEDAAAQAPEAPAPATSLEFEGLLDHELLLETIYSSQGLDLRAQQETATKLLAEVGLRALDLGVKNWDEDGREMLNQCFYLSIARSYLGPHAEPQEMRKSALLFKRTVEACVLSRNPEWATDQRMLGENAMAFADFLPIAMGVKDPPNLSARLAVLILDTTQGHAEVYLGPDYAGPRDAGEDARRDREELERHLVLLCYTPGHYKALVQDDLAGSKPAWTYFELKDLLDKRGVMCIETSDFD